ncbi:MAG: 2'-5' RNA ligase family protein [Sulfuricurvum sp.]|uniref:2'-5' RNA ligase family protein n=1 Tax=Sulfuricurvum sp. TaxID=2025608 RepID=UPI0026109AE3|nr:2'-5' RNA ligase family protein [Sulfuricurvum sp.]MDD2369575.1 2'-5' RNA ligase family protein [Sulfuricurvum sp.]MDD2949321.1 2'-5' RNA ligase family protein [Sulfuricurvum sp.]MDD5119089.1 2'-5' RNA ligase family protein [Sulfuricurvum sp.]
MTANRLFLAIPVRVYEYGQIQKDFSPFLEGRWRKKESLHITIAFLGHQFNPDEVIEKLSSFNWMFEISELSRFDYFSNSRVFVATTQNPTLQYLYDKLALVLGLETTKLNPHVTMMRVKHIQDATAFSAKLTSEHVPIGVLESKITLFQSHLYPTGAEYEVLKEWIL